METGGGPLSFRPVPREPTPSRDWKSIEWRRSTVAGDRYTSIVPVNLNWGAQWIQWNASLLSDSSPFPAFSLCISPSPPPSALENAISEQKGPNRDRGHRSSLVSTAGFVLDARRGVSERLIGKLNCRDNRFSGPLRGRTYVPSRYECRIDAWIDNVDAKRVFIDALRHDDGAGIASNDFRSRM